MKQIIFFFLLLSISIATQQCTCSQLLSQSDCEVANLGCEWDQYKSTCQVSTTPQVKIEVTKYCQDLSLELCLAKTTCSGCSERPEGCSNCVEKYTCAWYQNTCITFPGCSAFLGINHSTCQKISQNCTSDGESCIEISDCSTYLSKTACQQRNSRAQFCYLEDNGNCRDVITCTELPSTLTSHSDCFNIMNTCTISENGRGCEPARSVCSDYTSQAQCYQTSSQIKCQWYQNSCQELKCENANQSYNSDTECKSFSSYCIKNESGGCKRNYSCDDYKSSVDCKTNTQGEKCFWLGNGQCVLNICSNAPLNYQTEIQCKSFNSICTVTDTNQGCKVNKGCSGITTKGDCVKSQLGTECVWHSDTTQCFERTCENAPADTNTAELCQKYNSNCTANYYNNGCEQKTCDNAPKSITNIYDCESYLPKNNCIPQNGGGCKILDQCWGINFQDACLKDIDGNACFWDEEIKLCQTKNCEKAPLRFQTNDQCITFWDQCIGNSDESGCLTKTCQNLVKSDVCTTNYLGQQCEWKGKCEPKSCDKASNDRKTHEDCNNYLSSCTLSQTGVGCMEIPLKCDAITQMKGCVVRTAIQADGTITTKKCDWANNKCQERSCIIADTTHSSNYQCQEYLKGCYVNNTNNGCMSLTTCNTRKQFANCEINDNSTYQYQCVFDNVNNICKDRSCETATLSGSPDFIQSPTINNCNNYRLKGDSCINGVGCCTLNDDGSGCMRKPQYCTSLKEINCEGGNSLQEDCLWNGTMCILKTCSVLILQSYTHSNCQQDFYNKCTVNAKNDGCQDIKSNCQEYTTFQQCNITAYGQNCFWDQSTSIPSCRESNCYNTSTLLLKTHQDCQNHNSTCTVIPVVNGQGCVPKQDQCYKYLIQEQCVSTLGSTTQDCFWNSQVCSSRIGVNCYTITLQDYNQCESIVWYCKPNQNNTGCISKTCDDLKKTNGLSSGTTNISQFSECQSLKTSSLSCSINRAKNGCVDQQLNCSQYSVENCFQSQNKKCITDGKFCYDFDKQCSSFDPVNSQQECENFRPFCTYPANSTGLQKCTNKSCETKQGPNLTDNDCQLFDVSCTLNKSGNSCTTLQQNCADCKEETCCIKTKSNSNCLYYNNQCVEINQSTANQNCQYISSQTFESCQKYSSYCSINSQKNKCIQILNCKDYTEEDCYIGYDGVCSRNPTLATKCVLASTLQCEQITFQDGVYSTGLCYNANKNCTSLNSSKCVTRSCDNAISNSGFTHKTCNLWITECTVNGNQSGCVQMKNTCQDQLFSECLTSKAGECFADQSQQLCVPKSCYNSPLTNTSSQQCEQFMSTCTVAQKGGCQDKVACTSYKTEIQCSISNTNIRCAWNQNQQACVEYKCENIEPYAPYTTHQACYDILNSQDQVSPGTLKRCTVNYTPNGEFKGCMQLQACSQYEHQQQCVISNTGKYCYWNPNSGDDGGCEEKTCSSADINQFKTHDQCVEYKMQESTGAFSDCTVALTNSNTLGGCMQTRPCTLYSVQEQCHYDTTGQECYWESGKCYSRTCNGAPTIYKTHQECENFLNECTVSPSLSGCVSKNPECTTYSKEQCLKNINGLLCYWTTSGCQQRTCANSPTDEENFQGCANYLSTCQDTVNRCDDKQCDSYIKTTDLECSAIDSRCTSNGKNCISRKSCEQATSKTACVKDIYKRQCIWVEATLNNDAYCYLSECELASTAFTTDKQCVAFNSKCTLKQSGGCKLKTTCDSIQFQEACTYSASGSQCKWDGTYCRDYECATFKNMKTYTQCKAKNPMCTIANDGSCMQLSTCDSYNNAASCVEAADGTPCMWLSKYKNDNNTYGKCINFLSCYDAPASYTTFELCQSISNLCTTNGQGCVPIGKCKSLSNVGCQIGSDGDCMLALSEGASIETCQLFTSCSDITKVLDHFSCQKKNKKCTTDGQYGCMNLYTNCSDYRDMKASCYINSSAKICYWNEDTQSCRDQICSDILGPSDAFCKSKIASCTTDGQKCQLRQNCSSYYEQKLCSNGIGNDGYCFWTQTTQLTGSYCRLRQCEDVAGGAENLCTQMIGCIFDGISCSKKQSNCAFYTKKATCIQGIKSDSGLNLPCYWKNDSCSQITNCEQAGNSESSCLQIGNCIFLNGTCLEFQCNTIYQNSQSCKFYSNDNSQALYCIKVGDGCSNGEPTAFTQAQCFSQSNYTYTWNQFSSKCQKCNQPNDNGGNNGTNVDNNTTDCTNALLGFFIIGVTLLLI